MALILFLFCASIRSKDETPHFKNLPSNFTYLPLQQNSLSFLSLKSLIFSRNKHQLMATENSNNNPPQTPPPAPSLPQYPEMIMAAIESLNEAGGSNKSSISKHIEETYGNLPAAHTTLLAHHLNRMRQSGELVLVKNNYAKPDPNAPPRRGRGRPPKPKALVPPGTVVAPPRPRGRPPKPRDPFAPPPPLKKKSSGSGRPRGRPPKKAKTTTTTTTASAAASAPRDGSPRGRGRPPKVKPVVSQVVC